MKQTINIDLWNTHPNVTTISWLLSAFLGISEQDTELINEVPKELKWRKQDTLRKDPIFVFSQQKRRLDSLQGKVDFAITTVPLRLFSFDNSNEDFQLFVKKESAKYKNINILIKNDNKRYLSIKEHFEKNNFKYVEFDNNPFVAIEIMEYLEKEKLVTIKKELLKIKKFFTTERLDGLLKQIRKRKNNNETINFNLYAGPGGGKSTTSRILARLLRISNIKTELIDEVPKQMVWHEDFDSLTDQMFVFSQQNRKVNLLQGKNDFTVSDSPLKLQHIYAKKNGMPQEFSSLIDYYDKQYKEIPILLKRKHKYQSIGRVHNEKESNQLSIEIEELLKEKTKEYFTFTTHPFVAFEILKKFDGIYYDLPEQMKKICTNLLKDVESNPEINL